MGLELELELGLGLGLGSGSRAGLGPVRIRVRNGFIVLSPLVLSLSVVFVRTEDKRLI